MFPEPEEHWAAGCDPGGTFERSPDEYNGLPTGSLFGPIYAMLRTARHAAAERVRRGLKTCSKCRQEKEFKEFNAEPRSRDGHRSECRTCQRERRDSTRAHGEIDILPARDGLSARV